MMPDQLKKYKPTHREKKKREEGKEKWKRLQEEAKAQEESQKDLRMMRIWWLVLLLWEDAVDSISYLV
jgi:hypothetical protein